MCLNRILSTSMEDHNKESFYLLFLITIKYNYTISAKLPSLPKETNDA